MLLALLLDPHWTGLGEMLAFGALYPFVLATISWALWRGIPLVQSTDRFDKRNGWLCFGMAAVVAAAVYLLTLGSIHR